jgi:hypothetical protein
MERSPIVLGKLMDLCILLSLNLGSIPKTVIVSCWHYLLLLKWPKNYGSSPHFQEDSNVLKYVLFGYYMNKLWIFEVWSMASPKTWVGSTKTMIEHDDPTWSIAIVHFWTAIVCFLHCKPIFCLLTKMGKSYL